MFSGIQFDKGREHHPTKNNNKKIIEIIINKNK